MENFTSVNDPLSNLDLESEKHKDADVNFAIYYAVFSGILRFLVCLGSTAADVFLIYVIVKFERLKTKSNYFILHFAVSNVLYNVFMPALALVDLMANFKFFETMFCLVFHVESCFLFMICLFGIALAIDWCTTIVKLTWLQKFNFIYIRCTLLLYFIGLLKFLLVFWMCYGHLMKYRHYTLFITYYIIFSVLVVINIVKFRKTLTQEQKQSSYALKISNIIIFSWLPSFLYHIFYTVASSESCFIYFLYYSDFLPELFAFGNPMLVVFMLGKYNIDFRKCYFSVIKKSTRNYESQDLDEESDTCSEGKPEVPKTNKESNKRNSDSNSDLELNFEYVET